ncbi:hypothetical protein PUN28_012437 [Cardiocondyla obscurior]|uniref:Uncharacterized protein n=1 Tax=Cardiocondyla obscurior TaxID=286306 RepID=A0AAW2FBM8_9HYME
MRERSAQRRAALSYRQRATKINFNRKQRQEQRQRQRRNDDDDDLAWPRRLFSPSDLLLLIGTPKIDRGSAEELRMRKGNEEEDKEESSGSSDFRCKRMRENERKREKRREGEREKKRGREDKKGGRKASRAIARMKLSRAVVVLQSELRGRGKKQKNDIVKLIWQRHREQRRENKEEKKKRKRIKREKEMTRKSRKELEGARGKE